MTLNLLKPNITILLSKSMGVRTAKEYIVA